MCSTPGQLFNNFGGHFQTFEGILHNFESTRIIWMYNLYTEEWKKHVIPDTSDAPLPFSGAVATAIDGSIYTFGGCDTNCAITNHDLWKLREKREGFTWSLVATQCKEKSPSPRIGHTGWGYAGKLWIFGGVGPSPAEGYLNDHGDLIDLQNEYGEVCNNQLLSYNPYTSEWINHECCGDVPSPHTCYGGRNYHKGQSVVYCRYWPI